MVVRQKIEVLEYVANYLRENSKKDIKCKGTLDNANVVDKPMTKKIVASLDDEKKLDLKAEKINTENLLYTVNIVKKNNLPDVKLDKKN